MKSRTWRSPKRFLAPLALVAFGVAFALVWSNSKVEGKHPRAQPSTTPAAASTTAAQNKYAHRRNYTVRTGDIDAIFQRWLGAMGRPGPLLNAMFYLNTLPQ